MEREESFDAFYRATRRRLLHQAFALTGDQSAAQRAVRDAYVAAWHHWRKVAHLDDKLTWVRPRAWQQAQRRHAGRIWHRNKGLSPDDLAVLDALAKLSGAQRRTLLLVQLADVPVPQAARELGITQALAEQHLQAATAGLAVHLDTDTASVRSAVLRLERALDDVALPRASIVRRAGQKRRQAHTVVAVAAATVLAIASGAVAYQPPADDQDSDPLAAVLPKAASPAEQLQLPTADNLLDQDQIRRLGAGREWQVTTTTNNTGGDGINTMCQQERFADPDGLSAIVRTFEAVGGPERSAVQTVEVSASVKQAKQAYRTTLGWYAGCRLARLQVLGAYAVGNIGAEANVLMIRVWKRPVTTYSVGIARIGAVTTSTVGRTVGASPPPPTEITQSLADSVSMLCARSGSTGCAKRPTYRAVPPPPSGEEPGILAVADLPPVGRIRQPWVGIPPTDGRKNMSATTCDKADFAGAGASPTRERVYVIPDAKVPKTFGLSETYGVFATPAKARSFLAGVRARVARCEDRDLAATVTGSARGRVGRSGADWSTWTLTVETSDRRSIRFRVGFVRMGNAVAQVTFVRAPGNDIREDHFRALVVRAGDRLRELG